MYRWHKVWQQTRVSTFHLGSVCAVAAAAFFEIAFFFGLVHGTIHEPDK